MGIIAIIKEPDEAICDIIRYSADIWIGDKDIPRKFIVVSGGSEVEETWSKLKREDAMFAMYFMIEISEKSKKPLSGLKIYTTERVKDKIIWNNSVVFTDKTWALHYYYRGGYRVINTKENIYQIEGVITEVILDTEIDVSYQEKGSVIHVKFKKPIKHRVIGCIT